MTELSTPIFPLFSAVFNSIIEVFLLCFAGYFLANRGILDKRTQKKINQVNTFLFTPGLLFSKVAFFLSPEKLGELWIVPVLFVVLTSVSMVVAYGLSYFVGIKKSQRSFAMAASMCMNYSLAIALMPTLVMSVPGLKWGDDDNEHAMVGRALTYLMLYYTFTTVVRWSVGVQLLSQSDDDTPQHHGNNEELDSVTSTSNPVDVQYQRGISRLHYLHQFSRFFFWINALMTPPLWAAFFSIVVTCVQPVQHILETHLSSIKGALAQAGDCCIPLTLVVLGAYFHVPSESQENQKYQGEQCDVRDSLQRGKIGIDVDGAEEGRQRWTETLRRLFGFEQAIMLPSDDNESLPSPFPPPPPHQYLNSACANEHIYTEEPTGEGNREPEQQSEGRVGQHMHEGEIKTICIAVLSRMIITPVVLMPLLVLSSKLGLHRVFEDPIFIVSSVLVVSAPTALTLAQITQVASGDAFERLISRTLFWSYCVLTPPVTVGFVVLGIIMTRL